MKLGIITNPYSRANKRRPNRLAELEALVGDCGIVRQTRAIEELRPALEELLAEDVDYWVSDGGDGAFHWMMNVGSDLLAEADRDLLSQRMVPTKRGTVDFVARKVGIRGDADGIIDRLLRGTRAPSELLAESLPTLELRARRPDDPKGELPLRRLGFGVAVGGIAQGFFEIYYEQPMKGPTGIALLMAKATAGFVTDVPGLRRLPLVPEAWRGYARSVLGGTSARVVADGKTFDYGKLQGLHVGSITFDVGPVDLFPLADETGKLHIAVGRLRPREVLPGFYQFLRGRPASGERWHEFGGERLEVWAEGDALLNPFIDGERIEGIEYLCVAPGPTVAVPRV